MKTGYDIITRCILAMLLLFQPLNVSAGENTKDSFAQNILPNAITSGSLKVLSSNPRYFTDNSGRAIYLTGSHTWDNLQDWSGSTKNFDYTAYLNLLKNNNHNFIRLWGVWVGGAGQLTGSTVTSQPIPWQRTGPGIAKDGGLKYDFNKLNQAYFDRLRSRVIAARDQGIYVDIILFLPARYSQWMYSPYNSANNINGINGDSNGDGVPIEVETLQNGALLAFQEAYVKKVIDTVNDLDNVLYEIINEAKVDSVQWQYSMINLIKKYEATKSKQHPVGMTSDGGGDAIDDTSYLLKSPADWVSLGWDSITQNPKTNPLPAPATKVSILDTDHIFGGPADTQWFWKSFVRGHNPINMEATQNGIPSWVGKSWNDPNNPLLPLGQKAMGYTNTYAKKMNLASMIPRGDLTSTTYALANPGNEYLIYQPTSNSSFTVNLIAGTYSYEWFNPSTGQIANSGSVTVAAGNKSFSAPFSGDAVLYLKVSSSAVAPTATTGSSANITLSSGTLSGTVNPNGASTTVYFQYGTTSGSYTGKTANQTLSGTSAIGVSANLTGLTSATKYYYRVVATNSAGTVNGVEMSFTTVTAADITKPTGSLNINNGAASTTSASVTLALSATDTVGVTGYYLSNSSTAPSASASGWVSVASVTSLSKSVSHTLTSGDGTKTVYAWYKDTANNVSITYNDSITLNTSGGADTTAPSIIISSPTTNATHSTTQSTVTLSGTASDNVGVASVTWANSANNTSGTASGITSWSISNISLVSGTNTITVTAIDAANNQATDTLTVTRSQTTQSGNQWQQVPITTKALRYYLESKGITPAGGEGMQFIHAITYAPSNPNIAYLGVDTDTIWKSVDGGTTWQRKGKGINSNGIISIAVDPNNENRVFATGAQYTSLWKNSTNRSLMPLGIYRTLDGGENWSLVKRTFYGSMSGDWGAITIAFAGSNTIYAGTDEEGLLRSTDGGDTWSTVANYAAVGRIYAVTMHPTDNSIIYVGAAGGLKKVTSSGGVTNIGSGLTGVVTVVLINPNNPLIMFAGDKSNRIMKSTDGGFTFTASFTHSIATKDTAWMAMSPVDPNYVFVSFAKRTYGAGDWQKDFYYTHNASASSVTWQTAQSMDEKNPYGWVAGSLSVRFAGDSDSWCEFMGGPIAMHPADKNIALFFAGPGVVKKTTDGGANWRYSNAGYTAMAGMSFSLFSWDKNKARGFATNNPDRGIYFSEDNEYTFTSYKTPNWPAGTFESRGYGVAVGYGATEDTIVGALGSHTEEILTVSKDKGKTWQQISGTALQSQYSGYGDKLITFSPTNPYVIYAGPFRSIDGGTTWVKLSRSVDAVYWGNGDIVYSIGSGSTGIKIYKSLDRGATWSSPYQEIPTPNNSVRHIAVSPVNPDKIYLGKRGVGVYVINGTSAPLLRNENNGLLKDRWGWFSFMSIATDPNNDKVVYVGNLGIAGHDNKTIFRSIDGGNTWETINFNLNDTGINGIGVNPHDSYVYVGTWGGIRKLPPPGTTVSPNTTLPNDTTQPVVEVNSPTTASTYTSTTSTMNLSGSASDNIGVTSITWKNSANNASGTASGTASWSVSNISLISGTNTIIVIAKDAAGNTASDTITVTYNATPGASPTVATQPANNVIATSATLSGSANPNGLSTTAYFHYGTNASSYTGTTASRIINGTTNTTISTSLSALSANTKYYYRIAATNSAGTAYGNQMNFITASLSDTIAPIGNISINNGANYTNSTAVSIRLSASDNVGVSGYYVAANATVPVLNATGWAQVTTSANYTANVNYTLTGNDGSKPVYCWYKDGAGRISSTTSDYITLDTSLPTVTITIPTVNATYNAINATITVGGSASDSTSGINTIGWSNDRGGSGNATGTTIWSIPGISLPGGNNTITVTATDRAGNRATDTVFAMYTADIAIPSGRITINNGTSHTRSAIASLGLSASDDKGVTGYYLSMNSTIPSVTGTGWVYIAPVTNYNHNLSYYLGSTSGERTVYAWYKDAAGKISNAASDSIILDTTAPIGRVSINNGASYTNTANVTLSLNATDNTGITGYYVLNSSLTPLANASGWVAVNSITNYSTNISYTLNIGEGYKYIYCWYKDVAGSVSSITSDSIILDTIAPSVNITNPTSASTYTALNSSITIGGSSLDSASGISNITWSNNRGGSGNASGTTGWLITGISLQANDNVIKVIARDRAGNIGYDTLTLTYNSSSLVPTVTTTQATNINQAAARLNGIVNAHGLSSSAHFQYGTTSGSYTGKTASQTLTSSSSIAVSAALSGLTANTKYYYRAVATNSVGTTNGAEMSFTTSATQTIRKTTTAKKTLSAITIDGKLNESVWSLNESVTKVLSGNPDNTATFGTLWDDKYLYIAFKVIDDKLINDSKDTWWDDSVEVYIDPNNSKSTTYDVYDRQFVKGWNDTSFSALQNGTGVLHGVSNITGGYTVEIAVPWSNVGATPSANMTIGFDIQANDDDTGGDLQESVGWNNDGTVTKNYKNTSGFGNLVLSSQTLSSVTYLSNLVWTSVINGWGPVEKDKSNGETGSNDGKTITLNGITYSKGLGVHAYSEIVYALNGLYTTFLSDIGVDDEAEKSGSVTFQVWADGVKLYDSGAMACASATKQVNVTISGKNTLKLIVTDSGNGKTDDHADWANARLVPKTTTADTILPSITITNPTSSSAYTTSRGTINISGTASDSVGVTSVTWSNNRGGSGIASGTANWSIAGVSLISGTNNITVTAKDAAGNTRADTITVTYSVSSDTAKPTGSISINSGASSTTSTAVTLTLSATDNSGVTGYYLSSSAITPLASAVGWVSVSSVTSLSKVVSYILTSGAGTKTVYVWYKDAAGNVSAVYLDSISLVTTTDTTAPTIAITSPTSASTYSTTQSTISLSGTASDSAGVTSVSWTNSKGGSGTAAGTTTWSIANISLYSGENIITATARDAAGNSKTATITVTRTTTSDNGWKNFFAVAWHNAPQDHIKYAKQMGYDYIGINNLAAPSGYSWITERAGLKFYLVNPYWNKQYLFQGYNSTLPLTRSYTTAEKDFYEKYMVWKSSEAFPNNLATGWFDGAGDRPYAMLDYQQQAVIDYAVEKIILAAKSFEDTSIGFTFAGVMFDVPRLKGDFHIWKDGANSWVNISYWTGSDSSLLHSGITHEYATYQDGLAAFYKQLKTRMKQAFPNSKLIHEPARLYRDDWDDEWIKQIKDRADKNELTPDMLFQEFGGTEFVDDARNFNSGINITKDMVGSTQPLNNSSEYGNRLIAAKAGINGAWYNWFGRMGKLGIDKDTIENVAPRLKLIRVLPNWDNLSNVPLSSRSWDASIYQSPRSYADANVIYSRHWKTGKLFAVFNTHNGVIKLNSGETVQSIFRVDSYFKETTDGSGDITISGNEIRLKSSVAIPTDAKTNTAAGVGYILTLAGGTSDTTSPTVTIASPTSNATYSTTQSTVSLSGSASDNVGVTSITWKNSANSTSGTASGTTSWSIANIALVSGSNVITITAKDAASNNANDTLTVSYTLSSGSAPTVTTSSASNITSSSATLSGSVNPKGLSTTAYFQYGTASGNYTGKTANQTLTGSSSIAVSAALSGLTAATKYYYRVVATNSVGTSNGAEMSFTTVTAADTTKPSGTISINSGASSTASTAVTLALFATDNIGVTGYYLSSSAITPLASAVGWVSVSSVTSLSKDVSYTLASGAGTKTVYAWYKDAAGNVSAVYLDSISLVTTTDTTAPTIAITSPTSASSYSTTQSTISLSGTASDSAGVTSVSWTNSKGGSGTAVGTTNWSIANMSLYSGENIITVTAKDSANNISTDIIKVTQQTAISQPLKIHPSNQRYLMNVQGKAVYLTGSHIWFNIHQDEYNPLMSDADFDKYLDWMQSHGHNFTRLWVGISYLTWKPHPWKRTGPGIATDGFLKFDLTNFEQSYFDMVRRRVLKIQERGMYASIMFFGSYNSMREKFSSSAWYPGNNINAELANAFNTNNGSSFFTSNPAALEIQRKLARKFIDTLNDVDNLIWEVMNEPGGTAAAVQWHKEMINYVKSYESGKPKKHLVGMTGGWGIGETSMLSSSADWISPDWDAYIEGGPANYSGKVVISDTDHYGIWGFSEPADAEDMKKWVWKTFARGNHPIFMDPHKSVIQGRYNGTLDPIYDPIRRTMGYTLTYANKFTDLASMVPSETISSTKYALVNSGKEYLAYQPASNTSFTVNLIAGTYSYEWFNPSNGAIASTGSLSVSAGNRSFTAPFSGDAVLYLKVSSSAVVPTATTGSSANIASTSVTLNGSVNPNGLSTTAYFQYDTASGSYTGKTANQALSGSSNTAVSAALSGLTAATKYYYRVVATNSVGTSNGAEMSFTTVTAADTTKPSGSISINSGASSTASTAVTLTLSASDNIGVTGYYLSNSATVPLASNAGWVSVTATPNLTKTVSYTVTSGAGTKAVYVWYKDAAGNVSAVYLDSISLVTATDTTAPTIAITSPTSASTYSTTQSTISPSGTASDNAGVTSVSWTNSKGGLGTAVGTTNWSISNIALQSGDNVITVTAKDAAGNFTADVITVTCTVVATNNTLKVSSANPRYFTNSTGKAIYLTGSNSWGNFQDLGFSDPPAAFVFTDYLNFLKKYNHNCIRLWMFENTRSNGSSKSGSPFSRYHSPTIYQRTGPGTSNDGKLKFDVNKFNQSYFDRLRSRVIAARDKGIYVDIMLFEGFSVRPDYAWRHHPYNVTNNINGIDGDTDNNNNGDETHTLSVPKTLALQEAYVRKVIDTVNDLDNVLYEISNESSLSSSDWQDYMINFIKTYEKSKPKQHPVGKTGFYGQNNPELFNSPADWISPNADAYSSKTTPYAGNPPATTGNKVILLDTDHIGRALYEADSTSDSGFARNWVWKSFTRGYNTIYLEVLPNSKISPDDYTASWADTPPVPARYAMGYTLTYANKINLIAMTPQNSLSSTAYCLASVGNEYLIYQPISNTAFTVNLAAGGYNYEWFNPVTGIIASSGTFTAVAGNKSFTAPFAGAAVLYIKKSGTTTTDTTAPAVAITTPTTNSTSTTTTATINLSGSASDNIGVTTVTWTNSKGGSGTAIGTASWSVANISLVSGDNVITVSAKDAAGNSGTDTITISYNNTVSSQGLQRVGRWFTYNGQYKYLVGFDTQELAVDPSVDYKAALDKFVQYGINKTRIWIYPWFGGESFLSPWQYSNGKHNLDQWNTVYWQRVKDFITAAKSRDIVVEITIFAANDIHPAANWSNSTFREAFNKNFNTNGVFSVNANGHFIPEYFNLNYPAVSYSGKTLKDYQQALVDKTVAELGGFNNVYFEIDNEFPNSAIIDNVYPWALNWARRIDSLTSRPVATHSHGGSGTNTTGIQYFWDKAYIDVMNFHFYNTNPQTLSDLLHNAQTKGKVLSNNESGDFYGTNLDLQTRFAWGIFLSGGYFALYEDDSNRITTDQGWVAGAKRLQTLRNVVETLKFWEMSPVDANGNEYDSLITQGPSGTNKQLIAKPGSEYLAYFWGSKTTTPVKITLPSGSYTYEWYDPRTGLKLLSGSVSSVGSATISVPSTAAWSEIVGLALIIRKS